MRDWLTGEHWLTVLIIAFVVCLWGFLIYAFAVNALRFLGR